MWTLVFLVVVIVVVIWVVTRNVQMPVHNREKDMVAMDLYSASSYEQRTNHLAATPVDMGPISGFETPFRVNMFNAYME